MDVQRRQIESYAHMHGLTLRGVTIEEGVSGSVPVCVAGSGSGKEDGRGAKRCWLGKTSGSRNRCITLMLRSITMTSRRLLIRQ
jgi:hypothetical protein